MSKHNDYIREACIEALKSNMSSKHGCVIRKRNKVIAKGHNKILCAYGAFDSNVKNIRSIHAEMDALSKSDGSELQDSFIYVVRIKPACTISNIEHAEDIKNITCNSEPCKNCSRMIRKKFNQYNITLYYTTK